MHIIDSGLPGPTILILGGVHGNEYCGVSALTTIKDIVLIKGKIICEIGNPRAVECDVRFTETNLNRMFLPDHQLTFQERNSYEYLRAQELKPLLTSADILLDIHASNTPKSMPFIICEPNGAGYAASLPISLRCFGFDTVQPGSTDYYMNSIGKVGICIECGYTKDPKSTQVALESIYALLNTLGMYNHPFPCMPTKRQRTFRIIEQYKTRTSSFILDQPFADFAPIPHATPIGYDGSIPISTDRDCFILFARNRSEIGAEAFLLAEYVRN